MDILKTAMEWAKAESFSSTFFVILALLFITTSLGFWQFGKTDLAKAYVIPSLVAGALLLILGIGLLVSNQMRLESFPVAYDTNAVEFVRAELERVSKTIDGYKTAIFMVFPIIIAVCAVLIMFLDAPFLRASLVTTIAMLVVIMIVDTNANARLEDYKIKLQEAERQS